MKKVVKENLIAFWIACSIWAVFAWVVNLTQNWWNSENINLWASILTVPNSSLMAWDIVVENKDWKISIISNVDIPWVDTLSYNLKYGDNVTIWDIKSSYNVSYSKSDTWSSYVMITKPWSISKSSLVSEIYFSWNKEDINLWEIEMILADWSYEIPSISFN